MLDKLICLDCRRFQISCFPDPLGEYVVFCPRYKSKVSLWNRIIHWLIEFLQI